MVKPIMNFYIIRKKEFCLYRSRSWSLSSDMSCNKYKEYDEHIFCFNWTLNNLWSERFGFTDKFNLGLIWDD